MVHAGLMEHERQFVAALPAGASIGIIGCGGGREMVALSRLGFQVDGVDVSPAAVDFARAQLV